MTADELAIGLVVGSCAAAALSLLLAIRWRRQVLAVLIGVTGVLMTAKVGGVHAFTIMTFAWLFLTGPGLSRARVIRTAILVACALLLAVTSLFGDLVNSRTLALQLTALALSAGMLAMRAGAGDARLILTGALLTISIGALVGLLQVVHVIPAQTWQSEVSAVGRPVGIWPEPDWLGLFSALGVVLAWRLVLSPLLRTLALTLNGLTLLLSFARAAWIALVVSVLLVALVRFVTSHRGSRVARRGRSLGLLLTALVVVLVAVPGLRSDLGRRLESLTSTSTQDVSGQARIQQTQGLLTLGRTAAPFGHGLSASGRVGVSGRLYIGVAPEHNNNVASNWILGMWVDGALLALPLVLFLIVFAIRGASLLPGQMLVVVLANSLWSNAVFVPITWLCLGLTLQALPAWGERRTLPSPDRNVTPEDLPGRSGRPRRQGTALPPLLGR